MGETENLPHRNLDMTRRQQTLRSHPQLPYPAIGPQNRSSGARRGESASQARDGTGGMTTPRVLPQNADGTTARGETAAARLRSASAAEPREKRALPASRSALLLRSGPCLRGSATELGGDASERESLTGREDGWEVQSGEP